MATGNGQDKKWQQWLCFSAFTLAGMALEGSHPAVAEVVPSRPAAKPRRWRKAS